MKWISKNIDIHGQTKGIIYAKEKYFAVHAFPNGIMYSDDLNNWTDISIPDNYVSELNDIAYGNSKFIATGNSGSSNDTYIYISDDGDNWYPKKISTGVDISLHANTCKFINNKFIFNTGWYGVSTKTGIRKYTVTQIYETRNGNSIIRHDFRYNGSKDVGMMDIAYGNEIYVIVGSTGSIFTSKDLNNWTERKSGVTSRLVGISFGKGQFIVTGANGVILTSTDGINWKKQNSGTSSYLIRSLYANGIYMAVGYNGTILTSITGFDWTSDTGSVTKSVIYGLVYANDYYVLCAGKNKDGTVAIAVSEVTREVNYSDVDDALSIFDDKLNFLGVIDEFRSLRWRRKYYSAGDFTLVVAPYENNIKLLKKGNIIIRNNYTEAALIDTLEINYSTKEPEITVSGNFLSHLLKRRIVKKRIHYSGNIIDGQKELIREMTPLCSNFEIEPTSLDSDNVEFQCTYKNVYDFECKLSQLSNIGFRIVPNIETKVFRFENYKGLDRTRNQTKNERYVFSYENDNIENSTFIDSDVNKVNYVLVGGQGEDDSRVLTEVTSESAAGFDLFETFVDAKSESSSGLSTSQYINVLQTKGKESLNDGSKSVEATYVSDYYKKKWDLGDIVDVAISYCDYYDSKRITEVEETIENGSKKLFPVFGLPLPETISLED